MARKKKGRSRTTTANRMDYRTGGRVGYQRGSRVKNPKDFGPRIDGTITPVEPSQQRGSQTLEEARQKAGAVPPQQRSRRKPSTQNTTAPVSVSAGETSIVSK